MPNQSEVFSKYKARYLFKSICIHVEKYFIDNSLETDDAFNLFKNKIDCCEQFEASIPPLKTILNKNGVLRYRRQFRQFKYREANQLVKLTVRKETYDKIKLLSESFDGIDDMLFEYAFAKDHFLDTSVLHDMKSGLTKEEQLKVLFETLDCRFKELIRNSEQSAFEEGFKLGQSTKKIRSIKSLGLAISLLSYDRDNKADQLKENQFIIEQKI